MLNKRAANIVKGVQRLGIKHGNWRVFEDWLAMSAIAFSNTVDLANRDAHEADYMAIAKQYDAKELELLSELLYELVSALNEQDLFPEDVLGVVFHELELHNKWRGQFFTPNNVCRMMAEMIMSNPDSAIERRGYIGVQEPCCGAGGMVLAAASALHKAHYNYQEQMFIEARDVDLKCVHMCYLQLAIHGIPAVVIHGNTLTLDEYSRWYTPQYIFGGWAERLRLIRKGV